MIESAGEPETDRTELQRAEAPPRTVGVRYAPGTVGESARQVHLALLPGSPPRTWEVLCGARIPAELAETSDGPAGMPCMDCLTRMVTARPAVDTG